MNRSKSSSSTKRSRTISPLVVVPVVVGGIALVVAIAARTVFGAWLGEILSDDVSFDPRTLRGESPGAMLTIRERLLGRGKRAVLSALGPPRTASVGQHV